MRQGRSSHVDLIQAAYDEGRDPVRVTALMFDTAPLPLHRVMTQLREGRDEVGRAAYRILQRASEGALDDDAAAYVGAAALNVHAQEDARRRILSPGQQRHWVRWARLVPPPARTRLLAFAEATAEAG